MEDNFFVFGQASLRFIPIFAFTYLQNEIPIISKMFANMQSKLFCIAAMFFSFCLIFINTLPMRESCNIIISILLIIALSMSINYTYKDYTIEEGYYITIPYFIIYSCLIFIISAIEYPFFIIQADSFWLIILCSLICYILFSTSTFLGIDFHTSFFNYIAFIGLLIGTFNIILIIDYNRYKNKQIKFIVNFLTFQFTHIYLYLTHLLSVKFEMNAQTESNFSNVLSWCFRKNDNQEAK